MAAIPPAQFAWLNMLRGRFLVFDGPDGSGKTTQWRRFADLLAEHRLPVCEVREPGGTAIGEHVRRVLLDESHGEMDLRTEMLLYMASRAQLVAQRIGLALSRGEVVLADRFVSSTLAYQGAAGGLPLDDIRAVARIACQGIEPDLIVIFDVDEQTAASRLNPLLDRIESRGGEYHRRVREGFLQQAQDDPSRYVVIDARPQAEIVFALLVQKIRDRVQTGPSGAWASSP